MRFWDNLGGLEREFKSVETIAQAAESPTLSDRSHKQNGRKTENKTKKTRTGPAGNADAEEVV